VVREELATYPQKLFEFGDGHVVHGSPQAQVWHWRESA
jgi:hypothetical protein